MGTEAMFARITGGTEPQEVEVAIVTEDGLVPVAPLNASVVMAPGQRTRVILEMLVDEVNLKRREQSEILKQSGQ